MSTSIYPAINTKIQTILDGVSKVKSVYAYPTNKIDSYPSAIYYPSSFDNRFETSTENFKTYGYKLWIVCSVAGTTLNQIFNDTMKNTLDAVLEALDDGWDFNTIDGHRCWCQVGTGQWSVVQGEGGVEVTAEIDLSVKVLTN